MRHQMPGTAFFFFSCAVFSLSPLHPLLSSPLFSPPSATLLLFSDAPAETINAEGLVVHTPFLEIPWILRVTSLIVFPLSPIVLAEPREQSAVSFVAVNLRAQPLKLLFTATTDDGNVTAPWLTVPFNKRVFDLDPLSTVNFDAVVLYAKDFVQTTGLTLSGTGCAVLCFMTPLALTRCCFPRVPRVCVQRHPFSGKRRRRR